MFRDGMRESHVVTKTFDVESVEPDFVNEDEDGLGFVSDMPQDLVCFTFISVYIEILFCFFVCNTGTLCDFRYEMIYVFEILDCSARSEKVCTQHGLKQTSLGRNTKDEG